MAMAEPAELSPEQQDRRRRLIDAAFELGAEGGYEAVQMRDVSVTANVALATIYRYFSSKDDLLAAAMTEWTERLRGRVAQSPPRGASAADQMVDVLRRACKAMERQPKLSEALVRALSSADPGVRASGAGFAWAPGATVWFRPRRDLGAFFVQYFRYARGDGKAGLWPWRHLARYLAYLVLALAPLAPGDGQALVWALIGAGGAAYVARPVRRLWALPVRRRPGEFLAALALVPVAGGCD